MPGSDESALSSTFKGSSRGEGVGGKLVGSILGGGAEAKLVEDGLRDGVERGEDVAAGAGVGFEAEEGRGPVVEKVFEVLDGRGIR